MLHLSSVRPSAVLMWANSTLSAEVVDYYRSCAAQGTCPLIFNGVMHVLYRGPIDPRLGKRIVA